MPELLTTAVVAEELGKLITAFPGNIAAKKNPAMLANTYREGLQGIDADALRGAVAMAIREDVYFPKVARLRELAGQWAKHNRAYIPPVIRHAWNVCPVCGATAQSPDITRPKQYGRAAGDPHYRLAREYRMPNGSVLAAGHRVAVSGLLDAQARGMVLEMETVANPRTVMTHVAEAHHVRPGEPDAIDGAA